MDKLEIKKGLVNNRENSQLEFKKTFNNYIKNYIKTICAFANNKGGYIVFGVEDKPRKPIGLGNDYNKFNNFDLKDLTTHLQNSISYNLEIEMNSFSQDINLEKDFFTTKELAVKLNWLNGNSNTYHTQEIIKKLKLKDDPRMFQKKNTSLYTRLALEKLKEFKIEHNVNNINDLILFFKNLNSLPTKKQHINIKKTTL
ncbi:ATP-binding protein [Candidatus Gracilibacteria bacterium]|nr:ATP-binding protein [Candidatus Gracilibacteria bacterium]